MESKQSTVWAVLFVTFTLATLCLGLRLFSRYLKKADFWWDDWFAIGCYVVAIAWLITCPVWLANGLGMHITDVTWLTTDQAVYQSKFLLYVAEIIYATGLYFAKMSILCFYWRLFHITNLRIPMIVLMVLSTIWIIIRTFMAIFHCVPVQAFWDLTIVDARCDIDDKKFFFGSVLAHLCLDLMILSMPVFQIGKLQLRKVQKLGIIAMFTFGALICVCAIAICIDAAKFDTTSVDVTWNVTGIVIWATAEVNLVTVSACFPTIRPAFVFFFGRWLPATLGSGSNSQGLGNAYPDNIYSRSQAAKKSIKLNTIPHSTNNNKDGDEDSSTYKLREGGNSVDRDSDYEAFEANPNGVSQTIISGKGSDSNNYNNKHRSAEEGAAGILGISIKKETTIRVSDSPAVSGSPEPNQASSRSFA